jgi:nucleoside-diphosphate-sugar epimerase
MTQTKTALILGATGSFGGHAAQALLKRGWSVRALARNPESAAERSGPRTPIEWIGGDAMIAADVAAAAKGCSLIIHAANPPGYRNWKGVVLPMMENALAAARAEDARLVIPGNVYNFAPDAGAAIGEDAAQTPMTRKGKIRVEMERRLRWAAEDGAKVLILRAGDFFGPAAPNSALGWLAMRGAGGRLKSFYRMGDGQVGHAFAYLPDLAETLARLLEREDALADFEVFHFKGHWLAPNIQLAESVRRASGRPDLPIRRFPVEMIRLMAPFNETLRELLEMNYLWKRPIGLDNAKLVAFLGEEPHTALDPAIEATLADMGCLDEVERKVSRPALAVA